MHGEVHVNIHACTNDNFSCAKCELHDRVRKHTVRCTKKRVPKFPFVEALIPVRIIVPCLKLTIKTPKRRQFRRSGFFIVNFKHISLIVMIFPLLSFNK